MPAQDRVLVNCNLHPWGIDYLERQGYFVCLVPESDPEASRREAPNAIALVANASLPLDDFFFASAPRLRVVGRLGVGYDNVDIAAATRRGVRVLNTPLPVIEPVAEQTFALILALLRKVVVGDRMVRAGRFREPANLPGFELAGKTLGIIGMGNTGRRVAEIARLGFRMDVAYCDQIARPAVEHELRAHRMSLHDLLGASDIVTLHVNLSPSTHHLIDEKALRSMKPGSFLVNLSRGPVVDERALVNALRTGPMAGAALDVYEVEPPPRDHALFAFENVVLTPHRGGFSTESVEGCARVVEDIVRVLRGETPSFPVN